MAVDLAFSAGRLFIALFLVALNGFFVASEFAFVRVRSTSVEQLVAEGKAGADTLDAVMKNLDDYLAVTQLGITLASLGLGWAGEPAVATLIEPVLGTLLPPSLLHLVAFAIAFSFITFLHVVFGELAPKTIAIADAERVSLFVAPPMRFCYLLFYPALIVFNGTANAFTRMLGVPPASETDETLEEREIRRVLARAGEAGNVDTAEVEMIDRVFALDDTTVREVMVPRPDVTSLPADASLAEIRATVLESGHTRYPVVGEEDQVVGFVDVKDVLQASEEDRDTTAGDLAREVLVVPETVSIDQLLLQFRSEHQQMAAVIDEWGGFEGIATVEDVVEIVVGDLRDEFDTETGEPSIRRQSDGDYEMDGGVSLWAASDALGVDLESADYDTVGGLVLERLDRAPEPGDSIEIAGHVIEVESIEGSRIATLLVREADGEDAAEAADGDSEATDDSQT
ncbi:HlyC/CorC family transporter [Natronomonas halophila]|uniref:hemolysin family protein n=1 Tax=Natronomonas halophila TaxID=2747817 RepID=UPI0015B78D24|nr:hemolysin family protein [Natronomonas halophila]QLD84919.1 HlyC/CorC family transporter [Natronomonas halophila]